VTVSKPRAGAKPKARTKASAKAAAKRRLATKLRQRAEQKLGGGESGSGSVSRVAAQKFVHELQVHQVELEIQNEELRRIQQDLLETQASLEHARDRYRDLHEFSPIGLVSLRANGMIVEPNLAAASLLGTPPDPLRRRSLSSFVVRRDRAVLQEMHRALFATGSTQSVELEFACGDGARRRIWLEAAMVGATAASAMALISMVDTTELRAVQEELRQRTLLQRAILDAALAGIVTIDESGVIESTNPALETIFGYTSGELIGRNIKMLMPAPYREEHDGHLARYRRTGRKQVVCSRREVRGRRKDGTEFRVRLAVSEVHQGGRRIFVGFLDDLSGEERLEGQLRDMAQQATLAESRERRRLAEDLHDGLGQILALAKIKLGMLRAAAPTTGNHPGIAEIEQLLTEAHEAATSLTFQLSSPVLHDLGLVAGARWIAEYIGRRFGIRVEVESDDAPKPLSEAVELTLFRSLRELLINVAKHAKTGAAQVRIWCEAESIQITVEDEGVGFDPSATAHGFGLFNTSQRLQHVGGDVRIESVPGDGTKIHLSAPLAAGAESPRELR
jgi:two-component system CheB/CheR fusion protein